MHAVPRADGPLRSRFPGELALRDLPADGSIRWAGLAAARLLVLQLAERAAAGCLDPAALGREIEAIRPYVEAIVERFPADALRLQRVLDRVSGADARPVAATLLAAGDTVGTHGHNLGAYGFYRAAHETGRASGANAAALSAASRLSETAAALGRGDAAERWQRRMQQLVDQCR